MATTNALTDCKEGTSGGRKPDTTHVRSGFRTYTARPAEYGSDKYERANYLRSTGSGAHCTPTAADVERLRNYLRAAIDHASRTLDAIERHQATDPKLVDVPGMRRAAYAADYDVTPGNDAPPSRLPHVAPACTSLMMAIEQAIDCGLLPVDPGQPWKQPRAPLAPLYSDGQLHTIHEPEPAMKPEPAKKSAFDLHPHIRLEGAGLGASGLHVPKMIVRDRDGRVITLSKSGGVTNHNSEISWGSRMEHIRLDGSYELLVNRDGFKLYYDSVECFNCTAQGVWL